MKWNWGSKLAVAMAAFMIMVIIFGVVMFREGVDLVESDYYPKGQAHQELINKRNNAAGFADQISLNVDQGIIRIGFPELFDPSKMEGTVLFYQRTSDQYDKLVKLAVDTSHFFSFPTKGLTGRYIVKIDWTYEGEGFYLEKTMNLP
ncbi:MAG: FixH family protein [Bacteroidales bacterium]|nr:FixH family protein [Bacteroidales bacterium]